jgi:2-methylisocitrate lyase-like PEP mutase family enzyme
MSSTPTFLDMHRAGQPLLCPNPWDIGSTRLLASLGFQALATTSSGHAASLGRLDGDTTREEALASAAEIAAASPVPVTADLENGYAATADGVAETMRLAHDAGLAGCSIEDWNGTAFYGLDVATARVAAAAEAAGDDIVLTARADKYIHGVKDLDDTIERLLAYQRAGAHVLYAPGLDRIEDIRTIVSTVSKPVNVLMRSGGPTVSDLAEAGVARITVGGAFAFAAIGALVNAAEELRDHGTTGYSSLSATGQQAAREAFTKPW